MLAWLDDRLAAAGIERTGEMPAPRTRPWGTVWSAPTTRGTVWMKAPGPTTAFEVPLYEILARVAPEHVLKPIAVDTDRAWVLLPDGGPAIADRLTGATLAAEMAAILPQYGRMQRALAPHADELVAAGVADMRPAAMPQRFAEAIDAVGAYVERAGSAAERELLGRVADHEHVFVGWCERLAGLPGAPSLDHNDLHPWNILVDEPGTGGHARFYDWGDSVLAHPFACMLVPLAYVQGQLGSGLGDPDLLAVRDAYLDVFADLGPHEDLVESLELACRVGKVARALVWHRALTANGSQDDEGRFAGAPLETMAALLDDSHVGGA